MSHFEVEHTALEKIIDVRHQVLREGQSRETCYLTKDSELLTTHFALKKDNTIIGCSSVYKETHPDFSLKQSWRIRGMAVLPEYRNQQLGNRLLDACINHAIHNKADVIWCNARINAVSFYKRAGFKIIGDEFEIENIGAHFLMAKNLGIYSGKERFFKLVNRFLDNKRPIPITRS